MEDEWKKLEEEVSKLVDLVFYDDYGIEEEEDEGKDTRPANVKLALALLPILKDASSVCPMVCSARWGSVTFQWTNRHTLSFITCHLHAESKGCEVNICKYIIHGADAFRYFAFTLEDQSNKEKIGETLRIFLKDAGIV